MSVLMTGITGQVGSYLADILVQKRIETHGLIRRASTFNTGRIDHLYEGPDRGLLRLHYGDLTESESLLKLMLDIKPAWIINMAAQSHVKVSFDHPVYTCDVVGLGTLRLLEAARQYQARTGKLAAFYQASSSEMFGTAPPPQNELTPFNPRSPYAAAKAFAHHTAVMYREAYGLPVRCGIMFNAESPRRSPTFVTSKVVRGLVDVATGKANEVVLGNPDAVRDWGYAGDYALAVYKLLQHPDNIDVVIATGRQSTLREWIEEVITFLPRMVKCDVDRLRGSIQYNNRYRRPLDDLKLCGDAGKAAKLLNWRPRLSLKELIQLMATVELFRRNLNTECFPVATDYMDVWRCEITHLCRI